MEVQCLLLVSFRYYLFFQIKVIVDFSILNVLIIKRGLGSWIRNEDEIHYLERLKFGIRTNEWTYGPVRYTFGKKVDPHDIRIKPSVISIRFHYTLYRISRGTSRIWWEKGKGCSRFYLHYHNLTENGFLIHVGYLVISFFSFRWTQRLFRS